MLSAFYHLTILVIVTGDKVVLDISIRSFFFYDLHWFCRDLFFQVVLCSRCLPAAEALQRMSAGLFHLLFCCCSMVTRCGLRS